MSPKRHGIRRNPKSQLDFHRLEPRQLLAGISFDSATGVASIDGSEAIDQVQILEDGSTVKIIYHGQDAKEFVRTDLTEVVFYGKGGDDWFKNNSSIPSRAFGQAGNDILIGGTAADRLLGGDGNDHLVGMDGDDFIAGGTGDDSIRGNEGQNVLLGGDDSDNIIGGSSRDVVFGQAGDDTLFGLAGNDFLSGGEDSDIIVGNSGADTILGDAGDDRVWGGEDDDFIRGGDGEDRLIGGLGDDNIHGESGADHIQGNEGLDKLFGNLGDDVIFGGSGDDLLVGSGGSDSLIGGIGNDLLLGQDDSDFLSGDDGHDQLYAGTGDDVLRGGNGRDELFGQDGKDRIDGNGGNDDLSGGRDADRLTGGQGNDDYSIDSSDDVFDDAEDFNSNDDFEIRGTVKNLDIATKSFELLGIKIDYVLAFVEDNFSEGSFVKAEGAFDGSKVLAKEIELEHDDRGENFEARGQITNLDTTAQSFSFLGFQVDYSKARVDGSISELATIELEGRYDGNGIIDAHRIKTNQPAGGDNGGGDDGGGDHQSDGSLELRGLISDLDPSAKTFNVLGVQVDYSQAQIRGVLANGSFFKVDGNFNGRLDAREVETDNPNEDRDENVRATGPVTDLDTQSQTFRILGILVDFGGAEIDDAFDNGISVEVDGWYANGTINAEEVKR